MGGRSPRSKDSASEPETGEIVINPRRELLSDLDELPWPHRKSLPLANYRVAGYPPPVMFMYASRGCPYQCTFCLWPQTRYGSTSYRVHSPKLVSSGSRGDSGAIRPV